MKRLLKKISKEAENWVYDFAYWCMHSGIDFSLIRYEDSLSQDGSKVVEQYYSENGIIAEKNDNPDLLSLLSEENYVRYIKILQEDYRWWLSSTNSIWVRTACPIGYTAIVGNLEAEASAIVRPTICVNPGLLGSIERTNNGKYIKLGTLDDKPIKWIVLDKATGLCISKKPLMHETFNHCPSDYRSSDLRIVLQNLQAEIFSKDEIDLLLNQSID